MDIVNYKVNQSMAVFVRGRLTFDSTPTFQTKMLQFIESGEHDLVMDCSQVDFVDSFALRSIMIVAKKMRGVKGSFKICGLHGVLVEVFKLSGFLDIIPVFTNIQEATKQQAGAAGEAQAQSAAPAPQPAAAPTPQPATPPVAQTPVAPAPAPAPTPAAPVEQPAPAAPAPVPVAAAQPQQPQPSTLEQQQALFQQQLQAFAQEQYQRALQAGYTEQQAIAFAQNAAAQAQQQWYAQLQQAQQPAVA